MSFRASAVCVFRLIVFRLSSDRPIVWEHVILISHFNKDSTLCHHVCYLDNSNCQPRGSLSSVGSTVHISAVSCHLGFQLCRCVTDVIKPPVTFHWIYVTGKDARCHTDQHRWPVVSGWPAVFITCILLVVCWKMEINDLVHLKVQEGVLWWYNFWQFCDTIKLFLSRVIALFEICICWFFRTKQCFFQYGIYFLQNNVSSATLS